MKILTKITNGKMPDNSKELIRRELSGKSGYVSIEIKGVHEDKVRQYGYLYGYLYMFVRAGIKGATGDVLSLEDIDTLMKLRFWYEEVIDFETGQITKIPKRKREMSKKEMTEYIENICNFVNDYFGITVQSNQNENIPVILA